MKWVPGRVKDSDYYVNYDYEMWGKVIRRMLIRRSRDVARLRHGIVSFASCVFALASKNGRVRDKDFFVFPRRKVNVC